MGQVISNLKARFNVDTTDFKKGLKDGDKAVSDFKDSAGSTLDEFAALFGVNMSAVSDAVGTAGKSLNFLGTAFKGAAGGGEKLAIAMKVLKTALISTGIGAIVVGLGTLIAYFKKSGEGGDRFARILSQLRSVFDNVIERMVRFGEGIYDVFSGKFQQGFEKMKTAFADIGKEITEDWKAAGALADAEDALDDREIELIRTLEERRAKIAELRLLAKEENEDQKKKLSLLQEADALIKSTYGDEMRVEEERLRIMKERIAISAKDTSDELRRELAEQEAKISNLYRRQNEELKMITREKGAALSLVREELALEQAKAEQAKIAQATISNLTMPDFGTLVGNVLAPMPQIAENINSVMISATESVNGALQNMAVGVGEFFGALALGNANAADFGKMILSTFADLAIQIGKITIAAALAVAGIDKALKIPGAWPVALAAGIALVAVGSIVRGALSSAASGGGGGSSVSSFSSSGSGGTYDSRAISAEPVVILLKGELTANAKDLTYVIKQEDYRVSKKS